MNDLRTIYQSVDEKQAKRNLNIVKKKWLDKYPTLLKVWKYNWNAIYNELSILYPDRI